MLLMIEIFSVIILLSSFIYLKRKFIKKLTSYKLFPKIFWGMILGIGILFLVQFTYNFDLLRGIRSIRFLNTTIQIRGIHFVAPIFGIFVGLTIGASSRPFGIKKLVYCICAGFIGGLGMTIFILISKGNSLISLLSPFFLVISMPIAIGIADKSLFKAFLGIVWGAGAVVFCFVLLVGSYLIGLILEGAEGREFVVDGWEMWPIVVALIISGILIVMGIEMEELTSRRQG